MNFLKFLHHVGLVNTTVHAAGALLVVGLIASMRRGAGPGGAAVAATTRRLVGSVPLLVFVMLGALLNAGLGLYRGHVVPRDFMQDVLSARSFLAGSSLYPADMTRRFVAEVNQHPPRFSLWPAGSERRREEVEARDEAAALDWVQAHPPLMSLFYVPMVAAFSADGTYLAVSILSLVSLLAALALIARGLRLRLTHVEAATIVFAVLGWAPTIDVLRNGQSGLYLLLLLVVGWSLLRDGRPWLAGVAVGTATCLKIYPGILLVFLLVRDRRAFASAAATIAGLMTWTCVVCGPSVLVEYARTARYVTDLYAPYDANISLLGALAGSLPDPGVRAALRWAAALVGLVVALGAARLVGRIGASGETEKLDLGYALFLSLAPILAPIAWEHYLVVLLFPIAVLGFHACGGEGNRASWLRFLALLVLLAVPYLTFLAAGSALRSVGGGEAGYLWFVKMRTVSMALVSLGLACRLAATGRGRGEVERNRGDVRELREREPAGVGSAAADL